jgi:hypothetical protein
MMRPWRDATPEKRRGKVSSKQSNAVMSTRGNLGTLPVDSGGTRLILMAKFKYLMSPQDPPQQQSTQEQHLPEHLQLASMSPRGSVVPHTLWRAAMVADTGRMLRATTGRDILQGMLVC